MRNLAILDLWNTVIHANGLRFVERLSSMVSQMSGVPIAVDSVNDFIRSTGCLHEEIEVEELAIEFWRYELGSTPPMSLTSQISREHREFVENADFTDGAEEALRTLTQREFKTAIVSNATSASLEVISRLGIRELVDEVWISCKSGYLKPDPRAFLTAAQHFRIEPAGCLVVGDRMTTDILGARLAGMSAVLLDTDAAKAFIRPNASMLAVVPSLRELENILVEFRPGAHNLAEGR